jgi:hypothetical protein
VSIFCKESELFARFAEAHPIAKMFIYLCKCYDYKTAKNMYTSSECVFDATDVKTC